MIILRYFIPYNLPFSESLGKSSMLVIFIIELILSKDNIKKETDIKNQSPNIKYFQSNETIKEDNNNNCKRIKMIILILVCLVFQSIHFFLEIEQFRCFTHNLFYFIINR